MANAKKPGYRHVRLFMALALVWIVVLIYCAINKPNPAETIPSTIETVATIDLDKNKNIVACNPGNMLLVASPDFAEYKRLLALSAEAPEDFKQILASGACTLVPDGERVEVVGNNSTPIWWQVRFQEADWWIMSAFIKDSHGVTWGVSEMVDKMLKSGG